MYFVLLTMLWLSLNSRTDRAKREHCHPLPDSCWYYFFHPNLPFDRGQFIVFRTDENVLHSLTFIDLQESWLLVVQLGSCLVSYMVHHNPSEADFVHTSFVVVIFLEWTIVLRTRCFSHKISIYMHH